MAALLQCGAIEDGMADWKQITARIRRARTSKDPAGQLSNLFQKTRDAMVAFELARYLETSGQNPDAAKWYATAAERFRRADWKTKAQEAAVRLGAEVASVTSPQNADEFLLTPPPVPASDPEPQPEQSAPASPEAASAAESPAQAGTRTSSQAGDGKGRRRGRRGGRNRRRGGGQTQASSAEAAPAQPQARPLDSQEAAEPQPPRIVHSRAIPRLPVEPMAETGEPSPRGRSGDPGLSSRLSLLEMQLRRLLTCTPTKLSEADHAPAGPGVFVLTDSDLTSYYYVEACQTLRIAIGNLLRSGARRGTESIKPRLAEHLGIPESRVAKYLADHCVVRWLQLDEGASYFAHFVIAVIRPSLND